MKTFKQFIGEEGYDHYKDRMAELGIDHRSKETRNRSYTPSKQPKGDTAYQKEMKRKHGGKLPSAIDVVRARIEKESPGGIMKSDKK